jgi:hypothetical protein
MKAEQRGARNVASVLALEELLRSAIADPSAFVGCSVFVSSLRTQGGLAKYNDDSRAIVALSLNTMKSAADLAVEGGFANFDTLRTSARLGIETKMLQGSNPIKSSKVGLRLENQQKEEKLKILGGENLVLTYCLVQALRQGKAYAAESNSAVQARCQKEQRELLAKLTVRRMSIENIRQVVRDLEALYEKPSKAL